MKIYTRTGDAGTTALYGGERRSKADIRIESYGAVDELQAQLGLAAAACTNVSALADLVATIEIIQEDCFIVCCELARTETRPERKDPILAKERIAWLEAQIDSLDAGLPALTKFIVQGGGLPGATLHMARAMCRRAERAAIRLQREEEVRPDVIVYLNRLSDLLFVLARHANHVQGIPEHDLHS